MSSTAEEPTEATTLLRRVLQEVSTVIVGQQAMVERTLISLVAGGHCLLEGVPGVEPRHPPSPLWSAGPSTGSSSPDLVPSTSAPASTGRPLKRSTSN